MEEGQGSVGSLWDTGPESGAHAWRDRFAFRQRGNPPRHGFSAILRLQSPLHFGSMMSTRMGRREIVNEIVRAIVRLSDPVHFLLD